MKQRFASVSELLSEAEKNPSLVEDIKSDPVKALKDIAAPWNDPTFYRLVAGGLISVVLIALVSFVLIAIYQPAVIDKMAFLQALGTTALGALAGVLAQPKS